MAPQLLTLDCDALTMASSSSVVEERFTEAFESRLGEECGKLRTGMETMRGELRAGLETARGQHHSDMEGLRQELRAEMSALRGQMRFEMGALRTELRGDMQQLRMEVQADLRVEVANTRAELLKWSFLFWVSQLAAISGLMSLLR